MANLAAAFGMRPIRHRNGAPYSGAARLYFTTGASALYIGDPVIVNGGGNTALYYGSPISSLPTVILATAGNGNSLTGAVIGFFPEQATSSVYNPSGASRGVFVADDPDLLFEIMDDGVTTLVASSALSGSWNLNSSTYSGSTATGRSGWTLNSNSGSPSDSSGDQVKILGLAERPNNVLGKNAVWEVIINNHTLVAAGPAGV